MDQVESLLEEPEGKFATPKKKTKYVLISRREPRPCDGCGRAIRWEPEKCFWCLEKERLETQEKIKKAS